MKITGKELPIIHEPPRPGDIRHSVADVSKIMELTKIRPTPLEEGLKKTLTELRVL